MGVIRLLARCRLIENNRRAHGRTCYVINMCLTSREAQKMLALSSECIYLETMKIEAEAYNNEEAFRASFAAYAGTPDELTIEETSSGVWLRASNINAKMAVKFERLDRPYDTLCFVKFFYANKFVGKRRIRFAIGESNDKRFSKNARFGRGRIRKHGQAGKSHRPIRTGARTFG